MIKDRIVRDWTDFDVTNTKFALRETLKAQKDEPPLPPIEPPPMERLHAALHEVTRLWAYVSPVSYGPSQVFFDNQEAMQGLFEEETHDLRQ